METEKSVLLVPRDGKIEVRCSLCDELLDRVPDDRTAYFRVNQYSDHVCPPKKAA